MPALPPLTINTIGVVVGLDLVGDALIKLPFVRALRAAFPEAQIHWITSKGPTAYNGALREATRDLIDAVHEQPDWLTADSIQPSAFSVQRSCTPHALQPNEGPLHADGRRPKAHEAPPYFNVLIDTRNRWREARQLRHTVPHDLFLATAARYLLSDRRPPLFKPKPPHLVDRLLQLVELAAGYIPPSTGRLPVSAILQAKARQILPKGPVYIGFAPGAGNPVKIWPRENFTAVAALQARMDRVPVFLLGPQEQAWQDAIQKTVPSALFPLQARKVWATPEITINQTLAIGRLLDVAIANDSGTGHMLAAVDCPLISLFGPTSPEKLAPRVSKGFIIQAQTFGGEAMNRIPVESVNEALNRFLST